MKNIKDLFRLWNHMLHAFWGREWELAIDFENTEIYLVY